MSSTQRRIFTQRFDLSQVSNRWIRGNSNLVSGHFRSFWVSAASSPDFKAKLIFNNQTGSDSGESLTLGLNMSLTLSEIIENAFIEVEISQPSQWVEITFSPSEELRVGSVSVDLKVPVSPSQITVGDFTAPNDGSHFAIDFAMINPSSSGQVIESQIYYNPTETIRVQGKIFPNAIPFLKGKLLGSGSTSTDTYVVPSGYRLVPLSWECYARGAITAVSSSSDITFIFVSAPSNTLVSYDPHGKFTISHLGVAQGSYSKGLVNPLPLLPFGEEVSVPSGNAFGIMKYGNNVTAVSQPTTIRVLARLEKV